MVEVAVGRHRPRVDERVAAEEPAEPRPLARARRPQARDEPATEVRVADKPLVERHLAPFEGEIQAVVRAVDARHLLAQPPVVRRRLAVQCLARAEQRLVGGLCALQPVEAGRDDNRHEAPRGRLGRNRDGELRRRVRQVVGRLLGRIEGEGRADHRRMLAARFAEDVRLLALVPVAVLAAERGRPHGLQVGPEFHHHLQRLRRGHVEQDERALAVERHQPHRVDRERGVRVPHHAGLRAYVDPCGEVYARDWLRVVGRAERQAEVVQDLQRVDPRLEAAVLTPQQRRPAARGLHVALRPGGAPKGDRVRLAGEAGHHRRRHWRRRLTARADGSCVRGEQAAQHGEEDVSSQDAAGHGPASRDRGSGPSRRAGRRGRIVADGGEVGYYAKY